MERSRGEDIYSGGFQLNSIIISDPDKARKIALTYLKDVKGTFPETSDKYTEFVDIMKDYKAQRADITGVLARVKELFKGYPKLILGFNTFLPKGCEIVLSQEDELEARKAVEFDEAMQFVQKIIRFPGDDHVYKYFLDIMDIYRKETKFITKVHHEVAALLYNQPDLLNEFTNFLPNSSAVISNHYVHSNRTHKPHSEDRTSIIGSANPRCSENKYIACLADHDVSVGCHMGADMVDHYQENDHKIHGGKEKVKRKDRGQKHSQDKDFDNHGRNNVTRKHKSVNTLEDIVIELFHQDMREQVISLHEKVKARLQGLNDYQTFLKYIMHYRTQNITRPQLQPLVNDLLGAYPDLIEEVNGFIDRSERDGSLWSGHLPGSFKSEDEDRYKDHDRDEMIRYREITGSKIVSGSKRSLFPSNNEYQAKLFHELDLSECEQCTPSYRLLPKNYPIPSASQRTKIGAEVLNDHWVSVTSGSEDYSFKQMRKNQYEESLFRCEDDRFELDMLLETVNLTTRRVEELLNKINNNSIKTESVVRIEDHFTAFNLRCIERLYGDNRLDVMDVLRKNASLALPVILTRLKQKQEEWARCRFDFSKIWEENFAKNYHKSLDHRSFYFKQQDSKSLSTKALLAEIKEISEEKSKKENIYQHFASGERQNSTPHQEFKYCDLDIHDDIYQLMKYYIPQNFTIEQFNKVMKIWSNFVEPLFNVPIRHHLNAKNGRPIEDKNVHKGNTSVKEREEDDLSPNRDFEDDFATYGEIDTKKSYQNRYHGNGLDKVAYEEGEESAHRPYCDSVGPKEHDGFHDNKDESEGEAERFLETAKPLAKYTPAISHNEENDAQVFYGNDAFYVFFRLHQTLYSRLKEAKENSANNKWRGLNDTAPNGSYARFLVLLYTFLGGDADNAKYEDECRAVLGIWSFPLFTLDKLIYKLSNQLLAIAMDEVDNKLLSLYTYEDMKKPGRFVDKLYYGNARVILNDDNVYRFEHSLVSETDYQSRLTIRLMNPGCDTLEATSFSIDPDFEAYQTNQLFPVVTGKKRARIFLERNKRKYACEEEDLAMMRAMEGVQILNMMECKINCITYKMSYVFDTEDSMVRKGRKTVNNQRARSNESTKVSNGYSHRVQLFHKLLQSRIRIMQA